MSDTPRTDENEAFINRATGCHCHVDSDFARQLERELNVAKANLIDEAVKRMEAVTQTELQRVWANAHRTRLAPCIEAVRARIIQAAKGGQP